MMVIEFKEELDEFFKKSMTPKIRPAYDNLLKVISGKSHINNVLTRLLFLKLESLGEANILTLTTEIFQQLYTDKLKVINETGKIYIAMTGGYFGFHNDIEVLDEVITDKIIYPEYTEKDIVVKQWTDGTHWYAYLGDLQVTEEDEEGNLDEKWETEKLAYYAAARLINKNNFWMLK